MSVSFSINKTPDVCGGAACIGDTRIPVWLIVEMQENLKDEELLKSYPSLTVNHLNLVRNYFQNNKEEIQKDIESNEK